MGNYEHIVKAWFIEMKQALDFSSGLSYFDVVLQENIIRIYFPVNSNFQLFQRAFANIQLPKDENGLKVVNLTPDLEVFCIDRNYSRSLPVPPWRPNKLDPKGYVLELDNTSCLVQVDLLRGQVKAIDLKLKLGIYYVPEQSGIPTWEFYSPLKDFFHFWCLSKNKILIHAGSLVRKNQNSNRLEAILLVGRGGAGKSSAVLCGLNNGWKTCGDDYIIVCLNSNNLIAIYNTIKFIPGFIEPHPTIDNFEHETNLDNNKKIIFLTTESNKLILESRIIKILFFDMKNSFAIRELSRSAALMHISISTIMQIPACADLVFKLLSSFVSKIDLLEYGVGNGLNNINFAIKKLEGLYGSDRTQE